MNKKISFIPAIAMIALCAILSGTVVVLATLQKKDAVKTGSFEEGTEDEFADWETYRNEDRGFEVKYPESWQIITFFPGRQEHIPEQERSMAIDFVPPGVDVYREGGEITIYISPSTRIVFCQIKKGDSTCIDGQDSEIVIDGVMGILLEGKTTEFCLPEGREIKEIYICNSNNYFRFTSVKQQEKVFNQMLSTFRFIGEEKIGRKWDTYRYKKYEFEIKYPRDRRNFISIDYTDLVDLRTYNINPEYSGDLLLAVSWALVDKSDHVCASYQIRVERTDYNNINDWLEDTRQEIETPSNYEGTIVSGKLTLIEDVGVGDKLAKKFTIEGGFPFMSAYFGVINNGRLYTISYLGSPYDQRPECLEGQSEYEDIFNNLFSTFKFID